VSEDFASCKSRDWRMMVDGAGSLYPSEVAVCPDTYKGFNSSSRAKGATEHRFTCKSSISGMGIENHPSKKLLSDGCYSNGFHKWDKPISPIAYLRALL
jgi:hypothetical protein